MSERVRVALNAFEEVEAKARKARDEAMAQAEEVKV